MEYLSEMTLNGTGGDEQIFGELAVGKSLGRQLGDAALARGEYLQPGKHSAARLGAGGAQFGLGPVGQRPSAGAVRNVQSLA
jgi:hypothetical protein